MEEAAAEEDEAANPATRLPVSFGGLRLRSIGPASASGRVTSFAVNPENPAQYFVGVASGGVWRTVNNGITWTPGVR